MSPNEPRPVDAESVVVIRTDRLGDLVLSTPLFQAIKEASPACRVAAMAAPYALPALERNPWIDEILPWTDRAEATRALRARRFEAAIVLNPSWASCGAAWRAGVPYRTGPLSRPSSFVFLNRGVRQSRSRAGRHQSELDAAFAPLVSSGRAEGVPAPLLVLSKEELRAGAAILGEIGVTGAGPVVGLHPGSGESALRWPEERYAAAGRFLAGEGFAVVVTGGPGEVGLAKRVAASIGEGAFVAAGARPLRVFFGLLASFDLFLAPSTGPLHAAAALGVAVASPFPPLPSQNPERWGPRTKRAAVLAPDVPCPARTRCRGPRCRFHPCMEGIGAEELVRAALAAANRRVEPR